MTSFHAKSDYLRRLLTVVDLAWLTLTFVVVLTAYQQVRQPDDFDLAAHYGVFAIFLLIFLLVRTVWSSSNEFMRASLGNAFLQIGKEFLLSLSIVFGLIFVMKLDYVSRLVLMGFAGSGFVLLLMVRAFFIWWYFRRPGASEDLNVDVLIIGSGIRARTFADQLGREHDFGVNIVGFLDPQGKSAGRRATDSILGHTDDISTVLRNHVVEEVIIAVPRSMLGDVSAIIDACQEEGVRLRYMADFYDFRSARIGLTMVGNVPLLSFEPVARAESALLAKRIFDLVVVLAALPVLLPIFIATAIAIRLDSKGPIVFTQDRVGLHKKKFKMFKFRSMVEDAEARMAEVEHLNEADGPNFKIKEDPRITRVGRFLRKTSIDELPQLINVLIGDMSLVGPRPMSRRDVDLFDRGIQRKRFSVLPGITCIWQISGRSDISFDDWLRLDLEYIEKWSFWLDLKILFKTVPTVLRGSGAT